jgi:hypothetical protein
LKTSVDADEEQDIIEKDISKYTLDQESHLQKLNNDVHNEGSPKSQNKKGGSSRSNFFHLEDNKKIRIQSAAECRPIKKQIHVDSDHEEDKQS